MQNGHAGPWSRASVGIAVTVLAALMLAFAVWQSLALELAAKGGAPALRRELTAIAYQRMLVPVFVDVQYFRWQLQMNRGVPPMPGLRGRIDRGMNALDAFTRQNSSALEIGPQWNAVLKDWRLVRVQRAGTRSTAIRDLVYAMGAGLIYQVEDSSGLEFDGSKTAQDLSDITFAKLPGAMDEVMHADLLTENAQVSGSIGIPERITLARLLSSLDPKNGGDWDLSTDDWSAVLASVQREGIGSASDAARYARDDAAMVARGSRFWNLSNQAVVMRAGPIGSAPISRRAALDALRATRVMNDDLTGLLQRQIERRIGLDVMRRGYLIAMIPLAVVFLVGLMLLAAELTARRDRAALERAQQESARLGSELARRSAERALRLSEAQFRAVFDGAALGIAVLDRSGVIADANAVFRSVYGENAAGVLEGHDTEFAELMRGERELFQFEQHVMTPDGHEAWTDSTMSLVHDEAGDPYFAICTFRDMTELKRNERRMLHDMTHDALTGLPNRALFEARVREQFVQMQGSPEASFALLFVDLDRFKDINQSLGHDSGDFVISQVANRLRASIEAADVVARLGSDEFAVLVRSLPDVLHVEVIARRVLSALSKPIALGNRSIFVSASVGIAVASGVYARGEDVMRDADIAMRYAKSSGGGRFAVFDSKMHERAAKRLQLTTDLRLALERREFALLYQPIVALGSAQLVGCEALLRWNHPTEGLMMPADFMPLAEQTALAVPIGRFVLATACAQAATWKRVLPGDGFAINVNVSAAELLDPEFETTVTSAVRSAGLAPTDLVLEITESVVLDAGTRPNALVERLRAQGFGVCIDDFGTGYSSLRYLQQFKVDSIKIDRSFVSGADGDIASEPIVRTLMTLAEAFDVRVVAEGIETERQRDVLRAAGCRFGQGYFYSQGLRSDELEAMYPSVFSRAHAMPRPASA